MTNEMKESLKDQITDWLNDLEKAARLAAISEVRRDVAPKGEQRDQYAQRAKEHADEARVIKNDITDLLEILTR